MDRWPRHLRRYDLPLIGLVLFNLICIGAFLAAGAGPQGPATGGWRKIDIAAVRARIDSGELAQREASWWHPQEQPGAPGRNAP